MRFCPCRPGIWRSSIPMACPTLSTTSGVMGDLLAGPRIPSVPNKRRIMTYSPLLVCFRLRATFAQDHHELTRLNAEHPRADGEIKSLTAQLNDLATGARAGEVN